MDIGACGLKGMQRMRAGDRTWMANKALRGRSGKKLRFKIDERDSEIDCTIGQERENLKFEKLPPVVGARKG